VRALREVLLGPLHLYRRLISPALGPHCRYHPTCSEYAVEAVRSYGAARGVVLAAWRVLRCNPWSRGGFDPVSDQRLFRPRPRPRAAA
jgi:putative membrane protein insertion efficiency factor